MNNTLKFFEPLEYWKEKKIENKSWHKAKKLFDEKKYTKSLKETLNYIDKVNFGRYKIKWKDSYLIPNYKNWVEIDIDEKKLHINMEVVKINNENIVIIWRKIMQLNMSFFTLPNIWLDSDIVKVTYSCYLDSATPLKIYNCLSEFWKFSSIYTEEFIDLYWASLIKEPEIDYYKDGEYEKIFQNINFLVNQAFEYSQYFEKKLEYTFCFDVVLNTILNIDIYLSPKWVLKKDLDAALDIMWDKWIDIKDKVFSWLKFLNKIKEIDEVDYKKYVYKSKEILFSKKYYSQDELWSFLSEWTINWRNYMESQSYINAYMCYISWIFCSLYNWKIEKEWTHNKMINAIKKSNLKTWEKAAWKLNVDYTEIIEWTWSLKKSLIYYFLIYLVVMIFITFLRHYFWE